MNSPGPSMGGTGDVAPPIGVLGSQSRSLSRLYKLLINLLRHLYSSEAKLALGLRNLNR